MNYVLFIMLFGMSAAAPIFLVEQNYSTPYAHKAVLENDAMEGQLSADLRNHFYDNPRIAKALAEESWLHNKEMQVIDREADHIPRQKIFDVIHSAGFSH